MNKLQQNIAIAKETLEILEKEKYLVSDTEIKLEGTKIKKVLIYPEHCEFCSKLNYNAGKTARITVTNENSFSAAKKLSSLSKDKTVNTAVLNFASAINPGGGFESGINAQEEYLCRCSTLYSSIGNDIANEMYRHNSDCRNPAYSSFMLYSPFVTVFRDQDEKLTKDCFNVSVISAAAVNVYTASKSMSKEEIKIITEKRIDRIFKIAAENHIDNLVLGAWGCGVFGNDPKDIAEYFYNSIYCNGYIHLFDNIAFAILDSSGNGKNLTAFKEKFPVK